MDAAVGLAGDGTSDGVDDTNAECAALEAVSHSQDGIGGFAGLRDKDADVITEDGGLAVKEVRS